VLFVTQLRISEVAELLRVSDDTVRRWVDQDRLSSTRDAAGRMAISGAELAAFVRAQRHVDPATEHGPQVSARNRLDGIVTDVRREGLVAQVEIQAGPYRVVSLMTSEAAEELGLEPGMLGTAVVKATTVIVEATGQQVRT
jgi:molybdopterin-binding protein